MENIEKLNTGDVDRRVGVYDDKEFHQLDIKWFPKVMKRSFAKVKFDARINNLEYNKYGNHSLPGGGKVILDLCCGPGRLTPYYMNRFGDIALHDNNEKLLE